MGNGASNIHRSENGSIVIVGAGYGGATLGRKLLSTENVKIINPYDFMFHAVGALRAAVEPDFAPSLMIPLRHTFGESFIQGRVTQINRERNSVTLDNGHEITYSHLVLATGVSGSFPAQLSPEYPQSTQEETKKHYKNLNSTIQESRTIVCVGGGPVGVEMAGELKTDYPDKKIILIHANETLASARVNSKVQKSLKKLMVSKGIELMLNERVSNLQNLELNKCVKDQVVKTTSGKEIKCDMVIRCTGGRPNTAAFKDALGRAVKDNGLIKVDKFLRVEGAENIFAIGDIVDIDEEKMVLAAEGHRDIVAKNIAASVKGSKLHAYKPATSTLMLIPVGRNGGVGQLPFMNLGQTLTKQLKSQNLFTSKTWSSMGQKPPK